MRDELQRIAEPIRIGVIGIGSMGRGLLYQAEVTPGIKCVAAADIDAERAIAACRHLKREYRAVASPDDIDEASRRDEIAITDDGELLARCESLDVLIEATSSIGSAGHFAAVALQHGTHVVMMNAEADLIFGHYLMRLGRANSVVYTSCDGDQPGAIKHLVDDLSLWGFDLVMAGNIKGFLDRYSNPTKIIPEADKRNLDYRMATAYTDGTKLCVEMSLVANALGLRTDVAGMHGPRADDVREVFDRFDLASLYERGAVVDYILGARPDGGVFAVGRCDDDYQRSMLAYYKMGNGPFYIFYRPYHLCHVEAMSTVAGAFLHGRALLEPARGFCTNVYAHAKRPLKAGQRLDGIGGYACYGLIDNCDSGSAGLPICLADGVTTRRDIAVDERIFLSDVDYDPSRVDFEMFAKASSA